jgi:hypothetical protein|tara:strand:+ start:299 stop:544 length:246 start_codon:yes stop_codon:yes gene_type:complete
MVNIHRVFLPSPIEQGDGVLVDAEWILNDEEVKVENLRVYFILDEMVGKDVSYDIDLSIYLVLARQAIDEIETLLEHGSEY